MTVLLLVFSELISVLVSLTCVFDCCSERILFFAIYDSFLAAVSSLYKSNVRYKITDFFRLYTEQSNQALSLCFVQTKLLEIMVIIRNVALFFIPLNAHLHDVTMKRRKKKRSVYNKFIWCTNSCKRVNTSL
jgi:hypothetical protein